jgi:hypothetical protein
MGRRNKGDDVQQMETTRERLLALFDRPGRGARTLRGSRDRVSSSGFNGIPIRKEKEPSRTQRRQVLNKSRSLQETNDNAPWILDARPRYRRESRIRDKIRFFDGGMDVSPSGYQGSWKLYGDDVAAPSQSPTKYQQIVPLTKPGLYSVFPSKHQNGTETPIKYYGYLRPKEITPLPWRPLDSRRWERVAHLINSPETPNTTGRSNEQVQHSLITPTPTSAASAVKKAQVTHQDPKRNITENISVLCVTRSKGKEQNEFKGEIQENGTNSTLAPFTQALSSLKTTQRQGANDSHVETKGILKSDGAMSVERSKEEAGKGVEMELQRALDTDSHAHRPGYDTVQEIWIDGSEDSHSNQFVVVNTVVAQCESAEPGPMRLAETLRMIRLCRGRFGERSGTWKRKVGRSSEKGGLAV